jgi:hypothetical protein
MPHSRTLVISHTDTIGNEFTTRVITDFPTHLTDAYIEKASALYESLGMGVVSIVDVEETHHERIGVDPSSKRLVVNQTKPSWFRLGMVLRPASIAALILVLLGLDVGLAVSNEHHMLAQDHELEAVAHKVGVLEGVVEDPFAVEALHRR